MHVRIKQSKKGKAKETYSKDKYDGLVVRARISI